MTSYILNQLAGILTNALSSFVKEIKENDIEIQIFSGKIILSNLQLQPNLLVQFGLPLTIYDSIIGRIQISISLISPISSPIELTIDDIQI